MWLGLKRSQLQRNYVWRFIELCNQSLSINEIKEKVFKQPQIDTDAVIDYQI